MFCVSCLGVWWRHDIWISEKNKIWLSQDQKEISRWNKKRYSLFHKCCLLNIKNGLAKICLKLDGMVIISRKVTTIIFLTWGTFYVMICTQLIDYIRLFHIKKVKRVGRVGLRKSNVKSIKKKKIRISNDEISIMTTK